MYWENGTTHRTDPRRPGREERGGHLAEAHARRDARCVQVDVEAGRVVVHRHHRVRREDARRRRQVARAELLKRETQGDTGMETQGDTGKEHAHGDTGKGQVGAGDVSGGRRRAR